MENMQKWVSLFEQVIGRKPTAEEFMAGKACDFDFKRIKAIAGVDFNEEVSQKQVEEREIFELESPVSEEEDSVEAASSVTDSIESDQDALQPLEVVEEEEEGLTSQAIWLSQFETTMGRKPTPQEFVEAKRLGFAIVDAVEQGDGLDDVDTQTLEPVVLTAYPNDIVNPELDRNTVVNPTNVKKIKAPLTRKQKTVRVLGALAGVVFIGSAAGYYYFDKQTGSDVAADHFNSAIASNDYGQIAELLSTKDQKWTPEESKDFLDYLSSQEIDVQKEITAIAASNAKNVFYDSRGNRLLGMKEVSKKLGLFPEYQVVTYPLEVKVKTNSDELTLDGKKLVKNQEMSLGETKFVPTSYNVKGKTDLGDMDIHVSTDLNTAENNQIQLSLATNTYHINATLPENVTDVKELKLIANGKEIGNSLSKEVKLMDNQDVEVYASFMYEGTTYTTDKVKLVAKPSSTSLSPALTVSSDIAQRLSEAKKAKEEADQKAKEEAEKSAKEEEKAKERIPEFMSNHKAAVYEGINSNSDTFAQYYDTSSAAYRDIVSYATNHPGISSQTPLDLSVTNIEKVGEDYRVTVLTSWREYYTRGGSDFVEQRQTYMLRQDGDTFKIYDKRTN